MTDSQTLRRIAEEMRTYTKNWDDAEELERIADRIEKMERPSLWAKLMGVRADV
jgi:hypothetical protein